MLPLYGVATAARGFDPAEPRQVLRLRSPKEGPAQSADVALVRHAHEFEAAVFGRFCRRDADRRWRRCVAARQRVAAHGSSPQQVRLPRGWRYPGVSSGQQTIPDALSSHVQA